MDRNSFWNSAEWVRDAMSRHKDDLGCHVPFEHKSSLHLGMFRTVDPALGSLVQESEGFTRF